MTPHLYESLLPKLAHILQLTRHSEGITTPEAKQALLHATNDFKNTLSQAKDLAANLPGGELTLSEQDEVIRMLEAVRDQKRALLSQFAARSISAAVPVSQVDMEVDSTASTPGGS
ncbi:hypothetical protein K443DRAFT_130976 [Laccaria amethystina LaAM-08-1]|uniref:Mediator of RNA polymerase II transcription subunit 9 n=1 Tax=Laccaria amethystina LaAM-08-1 TaxID=1095629 RepID=A0A0C9WWT0_9AGAR|nr:hypothetical protein K443DRAFT_130976 [Laccaria amethystina LaAM-08-1]